jgi:hypothetical protein
VKRAYAAGLGRNIFWDLKFQNQKCECAIENAKCILYHFQKSHLDFSDSEFGIVEFDDSEVIPDFKHISSAE